MSDAPLPEGAPASPRWGVFTKFLVSLIFVFLVGAVLVRFQQLLGPLAFAVILAYMLNPLVEWITARTRLSWRASVLVVFLALVLLVIASLTAAGIAAVQQMQGLYSAVVEITADLPARLETLLDRPLALGPLTIDLSRPLEFGPFRLDLSTTDLRPLYDQILSAIQPVLSRTGTVIRSFASGTAELLGWLLFILVISYYFLNDVHNIAPSIERLAPEGYAHDARRLVAELGPIWNAFLRGQITLAIVMGVVVGITMAALGVRYAFILGLLAGLLEFIPIVGPVIAGLVAALVALFQPTNWLGLNPFTLMVVVLVVSILLTQVENNFLIPRIMGGSLNLHPIIILVGAIVGASLAGIVGLLLSAPLLATLRLFGGYVYRKMFDRDPWPEPVRLSRPPPELKWARWLRMRLTTLILRPPPQNPNPPRVEYSYTIYWTKQAREWNAARRAAVREALLAVLARPSFEANAYERRYPVPGLDEQAHSGASLVALKKVLAALADE